MSTLYAVPNHAARADTAERSRIFEQSGADVDRHAAEQHDPRRVGPGRHGDRILLLQHRAESPTHCRTEDKKRAKRRRPDRRVGFAEQQREAGQAERQADRLRRGETLAQQPDRKRNGERGIVKARIDARPEGSWSAHRRPACSSR
jgi:hypothetical protein